MVHWWRHLGICRLRPAFQLHPQQSVPAHSQWMESCCAQDHVTSLQNMYYHVPNICIPEFFVGVYCLNDVRVIQVPMASSFSGRIVCFYMVLCYFFGKKFGFAPNPYQTRTISRKTSGLSQYLGYPQPVPNPYQTRTLPVLTRTFSMGLDGSDFSNFSYVYDWVFSIIKIENPFPGCTQLWDRFVCENIIQVDSDS